MRPISFQRKPPILKRFGIGNSCFYTRIKDGLIPPPVSLSNGRVSVWPEHEIDAVAAAMLTGSTDDQIRELVKTLVAARQTAGQVA